MAIERTILSASTGGVAEKVATISSASMLLLLRVSCTTKKTGDKFLCLHIRLSIACSATIYKLPRSTAGQSHSLAVLALREERKHVRLRSLYHVCARCMLSDMLILIIGCDSWGFHQPMACGRWMFSDQLDSVLIRTPTSPVPSCTRPEHIRLRANKFWYDKFVSPIETSGAATNHIFCIFTRTVSQMSSG